MWGMYVDELTCRLLLLLLLSVQVVVLVVVVIAMVIDLPTDGEELKLDLIRVIRVTSSS